MTHNERAIEFMRQCIKGNTLELLEYHFKEVAAEAAKEENRLCAELGWDRNEASHEEEET